MRGVGSAGSWALPEVVGSAEGRMGGGVGLGRPVGPRGSYGAYRGLRGALRGLSGLL